MKPVIETTSAIKSPWSPGRTLLQRLMQRRFASVLTALTVVALLSLAIPKKETVDRTPQESVQNRRAVEATTMEVLDGDTLLVRINNKVEKIRLIGIDAPEAVIDEKALSDSKRSRQSVKSIVKLGHLASQYTRSVVAPGTELKIVFDRQKTDRYGRLLGYVFLPDSTLLNEKIIADGYAGLLTIEPNVRYEDRLTRAHSLAREKQTGLWNRRDHRVLEVLAD